ncbi:biotin transporter BioY [Granulicella tundricola]|uniref:Biotin transporter n=1 Tax=Granulicella tundricola (strain ATCC BAA-1859 / DSM 23138 / MP5ACTX9) TaxID=1198114 RepID=E8WY57_GRATM|nr:biotin transporter BioY [Granulicella tundricola]ADW68684.1 BioY protein [Granulicella tundricola MP5ACTX9]
MQTAHPIQAAAPVSFVPRNATLVDKAILAVAGSVFVAICAHVSVPLWFTPVPLTLGNMAVILVGLCLGPSTAFAAMVLYLCEGAMGMPVFNPGGPAGMAHLMGPNAGYLFAYPVAAAVAGYLAKAISLRGSKYVAGIVGSVAGTALVIACGVSWLASLLHLNAAMAFKLGAAPFLPGEVIKVAAAAGIYSAIARWRKA